MRVIEDHRRNAKWFIHLVAVTVHLPESGAAPGGPWRTAPGCRQRSKARGGAARPVLLPSGSAGGPFRSLASHRRGSGHGLQNGLQNSFWPHPMLDAGVDLRDVHIAARHAGPATTMRYHRARQNLDCHLNYILAAVMPSGT